MLRMYDVEGKLLSGIKTMYVDSSGSENEWFRIDRGVRQGVSCLLGYSMYMWM